MAKPEWGAKRICHHCGARYYDMLRDPIVCPKCGTPFDPEAFLRSRRSRSAIIEEAIPAKPVIDAGVEGEIVEPEEVDEVEAIEEAGEEDEVTPAAPDLTPAEAEEEEYEDPAEGEEDLMEDASELGDDDVDDVIGLEDGAEEDH